MFIETLKNRTSTGACGIFLLWRKRPHIIAHVDFWQLLNFFYLAQRQALLVCKMHFPFGEISFLDIERISLGVVFMRPVFWSRRGQLDIFKVAFLRFYFERAELPPSLLFGLVLRLLLVLLTKGKFLN